MNRRSFLIDTDTASDDAVALIMALRAPDVDVLAITTVAGNVNVEQATRNALYTVELCDFGTPVYRGAAKPLERPLEDATWFHGMDGLGDRGYPAPRKPAYEGHAVDAIIDIIGRHPGLELVTLGPLTNIALARCKRIPTLAAKVSRCVVMGERALLRWQRNPGGRVQLLDRSRSRTRHPAERTARGNGWLATLPPGTPCFANLTSDGSWPSTRNWHALPSTATATPVAPI